MFYKEISFRNKLINICEKSNKIALDIYNKYLTDGTEITYKKDNSPLTIADLEVNKYICSQLKQINKNYSKNILIISEENRDIPYIERKLYDWVWLVDPIDGTKEFIKKNGQFTVNIGLCYKGNPVFGIVGIPVSGLIYYGCEQSGSYKLNTKNNKSTKISVAKFNLLNENIRVVCSSSHINKETEDYIKQFKNPILKRAGSSIKLLQIAEGKADIYPRLGLTSEWDTCAAHAILIFAGGTIISYTNNQVVLYNKENLLNPYFICMGIFI